MILGIRFAIFGVGDGFVWFSVTPETNFVALCVSLRQICLLFFFCFFFWGGFCLSCVCSLHCVCSAVCGQVSHFFFFFCFCVGLLAHHSVFAMFAFLCCRCCFCNCCNRFWFEFVAKSALFQLFFQSHCLGFFFFSAFVGARVRVRACVITCLCVCVCVCVCFLRRVVWFVCGFVRFDILLSFSDVRVHSSHRLL